jgi:hypothetical protein
MGLAHTTDETIHCMKQYKSESDPTIHCNFPFFFSFKGQINLQSILK